MKHRDFSSFLTNGIKKGEISHDFVAKLMDTLKQNNYLREAVDLLVYPTREEALDILNNHSIHVKSFDDNANYYDEYRLAKLQDRINKLPAKSTSNTSDILLKCIVSNKLSKLDKQFNNDNIKSSKGILPLNTDQSSTTILMGGKGASLNELTKIGANCPEGFFITTDFDPSSLENYKQELLDRFDELGSDYVAVRSSATKEDGLKDSFAGVFDTQLFVDKENLLDAIKSCYNSLHEERAIEYCLSKNINKDELKMAIVVQRMLNSEVSGVIFSRNPIRNNDDVIIEACFGVGEALVSGEISADTYYIDGIKLSKEVRSQTHRISLRDGEKRYGSYDIEPEIGGLQKLSDQYIYELSYIAKRIDQHYGKPMDIEWALEKGRLYILQARPITTLNTPEDICVSKGAQQFIEFTKGEEIWVPLHNVSPFIQASGWHQDKYIGKHYRDKSPMHMVYAMDKSNSVQFINQTKPYNIAKEVLGDYLKDTNSIKNRINHFFKGIEKINSLYDKYTYDNLSELNNETLLSLAESIRDQIWDANGSVFFSISFDKKILKEVVNTHGLKISQMDYDLLFTQGTEMLKDSFDVARVKDYYSKLNNSGIQEAMQYITASFFDVAQGDELTKKIDQFLFEHSGHNYINNYITKGSMD